MPVEIFFADLSDEKKRQIAEYEREDFVDDLKSFEKSMNWDTIPIFIYEVTQNLE